jgi:hypothetical protein
MNYGQSNDRNRRDAERVEVFSAFHLHSTALAPVASVRAVQVSATFLGTPSPVTPCVTICHTVLALGASEQIEVPSATAQRPRSVAEWEARCALKR